MFFGRDDLILQLNGLWRKRVSSLVTCRGRRRVGKSTLIREFSRTTQSRFIKIEGARPDAKTTRDDELRVFAEQLAAQTGCEDTPPSNWLNAFIRLASQIRDDERTVILLDEISWLGFGEPMFADIFRIAWENYLKQHDRLVVVLCGSVSSWVKENFIDNRAYVGRRSLDVVVNELPPHECVRFWGEAASRLATREIIDVLSVTGDDLIFIAGAGSLCLILLLLNWKKMVFSTVMSDVAQSEGVCVKRLSAVFMILTALFVALALKTTGLLLISALLVIPPCSARFFAKTPEQMAGFGVIIGVFCVIGGLACSVFMDVPAAPAMEVFCAVFFSVCCLYVKCNKRIM